MSISDMALMAYITLLYILVLEPMIAMDASQQRFDFPTMNFPEDSISTIYGKSHIAKSVSQRQLSKFFLYTPRIAKKGLILDARSGETLQEFNPNLGTKMIIHGFLDSVSIAPWMHDMKDELLRYEDYNVIVVDWSSGNSIPYSRAAANTVKVGQEISELVKKLLADYGAKPKTFHLIGHSLGAHIAGFVGESIKDIGRITGLDPAAPLFQNEDPSQRLDPTDAIFVDVIHTDAGGIGMVDPTGHEDFYPNGGREQPGCTASNSLRALIQEGVIEGVRNLICSHMRAPLFFTASINNHECQMTGVACDSWDEFNNGDCLGCGTSGERCAVMGFHASKKPVGNLKVYLLTLPKEPYCAYDYRISFEIEWPSSSTRGLLKRLNDLPIIGEKHLQLFVQGSEGNAEFELDDDKFPQNSENVAQIFSSEEYLGIVNSVVVEWKPNVRAAKVLSAVTGQGLKAPVIRTIQITPVKERSQGSNIPASYILCSRERNSGLNKKITYKTSFCQNIRLR